MKLTPDTVTWLRRTYQRKRRQVAKIRREYSKPALAARLGVHVNTVDRALRGITHKPARKEGGNEPVR